MLRAVKYRDAIREYARYRVIAGHVQPAPGDALPWDRMTITLLRDPVDRLLSRLFFVRNVHVFGASDAALRNSDIDALVESMAEEKTGEFNDHLAALWPFGWNCASTASLQDRISAAKAALDAFDIVGLQHRLEESVLMCAARLGWQPPTHIGRENVTPGRVTAGHFPSHTVARLRRLLEPDHEVYVHAARIFERQVRDVSTTRHSTWSASPGSRAAMTCSVTAQSSQEPETRTERSSCGDSGIEIRSVLVRGQISPPPAVCVGEWVSIDVAFHSVVVEHDLTIGFAIRDHSDRLIFGTNTRLLGDKITVTPGDFIVSFRFFNNLGLGLYNVTAALHRAESHLDKCFHWMDRAASFEVIDRLVTPFEGCVRLDVEARGAAISHGAEISVARLQADQEQAITVGSRNPPLKQFAARLAMVSEMPRLPASADALVNLHVTNASTERWPAFGRSAVRVSYRWIDRNDHCLGFDGVRTPLAHDVEPGSSINLRCLMHAPDSEGLYTLIWTAVQEEVTWFDQIDSESQHTCQVEID